MKRSMAGFGVLAAAWALALPGWTATTVQSVSVETAMDAKSEQVFKTLDQPFKARAGIATLPLLSAKEAAALGRRLRSEAGLEVYLVIDRLQVRRDPGSLLRLELAGPATRQRSAPAAEAVGDFNVFGISHAEGATAQRSFEVTPMLRKLAGSGEISLRVVTGAEAAADAEVEIGKISLLLRAGGKTP